MSLVTNSKENIKCVKKAHKTQDHFDKKIGGDYFIYSLLNSFYQGDYRNLSFKMKNQHLK